MNSPVAQQLDVLYDQQIAEKATVIYNHEYMIDDEAALYLITWSPIFDEQPDCHFEVQHEFNIKTLVSYLKGCSLGIFCVEANQQGFPHYHGWYQLSDDPVKEQLRICMMKVLLRTGKVKVTKSRGHYKIGCWHNHSNCLYYYKKDCIQSQLLIAKNPVTVDSVSSINWTDLSYARFFSRAGKRQSITDLENQQSLRDFYEEFYRDSIN